MRFSKCNNLMEFRAIAKRRLPTPVFHYIDGGADDEVSLRRNTAAFDDYEIMPSQLHDVSNIELRSTLFGEEVDWPVMISPTGASLLFHGDGETAVARAASKFGMFYSLSSCNVNACGGPNQWRGMIGEQIDMGLSDREIFEKYRDSHGPDFWRPHLLR